MVNNHNTCKSGFMSVYNCNIIHAKSRVVFESSTRADQPPHIQNNAMSTKVAIRIRL